MGLSLAEIKELIVFGVEAGLQQLSAEGVVVVYGPPMRPQQLSQEEQQDETAKLIEHYSAVGRRMSSR